MDAVTCSTSDARALAAVREGQEAAFLVLVARYHCSMVELAETFVDNRASAEQVVREAWADVLARAGTFPGRLSVRCWMFQILIERARLRTAQEASSVSSSTSQAKDNTAALFPTETFFDDYHPIWPGRWLQSPQAWLDQELDTASAREQALNELRSLPPLLRRVMMLRDVEGWTAVEVCETMQLSALEQRACLHRARATVRAWLGAYFRFASR